MTKKLAVIIPHFNDVNRLERCLTALSPQITRDFEVIVVDNGSTEPMDSIRTGFDKINIVIEQEKGAAAARNRGVLETSAPYLAFLDADCVPSANWLAYAGSVAGSGDLIGGEVEVFHETEGALTGAQAFEAVFAFDIKAYIETKNFTVTANLVTSREIFEAVGPFRPGVSEDLDWCIRAKEAGYRLVYDPELKVSHPSRNDWAALRKKWVRMTAEGYGLVPKTPLGRLKWGLRALALVPSILVHAPKLFVSPNLDSLRARIAGLGTLARLRFLRFWWMLQQVVGRKIS